MKQLINKLLIASLFVICLVLIPTKDVKADTWEFMGNFFTVDLNQSVYNPGEFMSINGLIANIDGEPSMMHMDISFFSPDTYGSVPSPWLWVDKVRGENDITHLYPDTISDEIQRSAPTAVGSYGIGVIMYVDKYEVDDNGNVTPNYVEYVAYPSTFYTVENPTCSNGATNYPTCTKSCLDGSTTVTNGECPVTVTVTATNNITNLKSTSNLTVPYNTSVRISWVASENATSCDSGGYGTGITGFFDVPNMTSTTNYTITCSN